VASTPGTRQTENEATVRATEAADLVPEARVRVIEGPDRGSEVTVDRARMTIGRARGNDLVLTDPMISAIHLEIAPGPEGVVVKDLGSTNGTWLGGNRVREVVLLGEAELRLGSTVLAFSTLSTVMPVEVSGESRFGRLLGASAAMRRTFALLERLAASDLTVLLEGETGTGKEEVARALHERSSRAHGPFVVLDCAALPAGLAEAAILGHERGAFTGADHRRSGSFEAAHGGTILLDEIGELPGALQPKLLRVLESRTVTPVGSSHPHRVDVRVIAATHRDLRKAVNDNEFRSDLYYRLAEVHVTVPPLRDRAGDAALLAEHFLWKASVRSGAKSPRFGPEALERLARYDWPGNVRELRNLVERLAMLHPGETVDADRVAEELRPGGETHAFAIDSAKPYKQAKEAALKHFDACYLADLYERCGGNLSQAAREAGLMRHHLRLLFRRAGIVAK